MKIKLYLAGKIGKNDFRHDIVTGLRQHEWDYGPIETPDFIYMGPFFKSCDHGCYHSQNGHGLMNPEGCIGNEENPYSQDDVIASNNAAMDAADLILAYITSADCYGTLVEIGRATVMPQKRVVIAFAPGIPAEDFWYAAKQADKVYFGVCDYCLPGLISREIKTTHKAPAVDEGDWL